MAAWSLLAPASRPRFRALLEVDDDTWARGRGWALSLGIVALPYHLQSNPGFAATARRLIDAVLAAAD